SPRRHKQRRGYGLDRLGLARGSGTGLAGQPVPTRRYNRAAKKATPRTAVPRLCLPPEPAYAMQFDSFTFLIFFAVVLAGHNALRGWGARKNFLLGASYLFYAAWNPPFLLLL